MKIAVYRDKFRLDCWFWCIYGKWGVLHAESIATYESKESCLRAVRRMFGKDVKVEVVR